MRIFLFIFLFIYSGFGFSQINFGENLSKTMIATLSENDSIIYYQCRVILANVEIKTANQKIESKAQQISVTEKFLITRQNNLFQIKYFTSGLTVLPNRKFSALKMREKDYWGFSFKSERQLTENEILFLAGMEKSGRATTEYDFVISKYTTNEIIIRQRKNFEQLLIKEKLSISEALKL